MQQVFKSSPVYNTMVRRLFAETCKNCNLLTSQNSAKNTHKIWRKTSHHVTHCSLHGSSRNCIRIKKFLSHFVGCVLHICIRLHTFSSSLGERKPQFPLPMPIRVKIRWHIPDFSRFAKFPDNSRFSRLIDALSRM